MLKAFFATNLAAGGLFSLTAASAQETGAAAVIDGSQEAPVCVRIVNIRGDGGIDDEPVMLKSGRPPPSGELAEWLSERAL